jgi:hypothetical protein
MIKHLSDEYINWVNVKLPAASKNNPGKYPVRYNHCWGRIILDFIFKDDWRKHLKSPAYTKLSYSQLIDAIDTAEELEHNPEYAHKLNKQSLDYRGKGK